MRRYVILEHRLPPGAPRRDHWDLMLQSGDTLRTWALAAPPAPRTAAVAEPLADHRASYLDYEGPVSGDRGHVTRWDCGSYTIVEQSESTLIVELHGARFCGRASLERVAGDYRWRFEPFDDDAPC